jgi:hypothetical protein
MWQVFVLVAMVVAFFVFAYGARPILAAGIFLGAIVASWIKGLTMRSAGD